MAKANLRNKVQRIAARVCKLEGHRSQARIMDVVEVIGLLEDLRYHDPEVVLTLNQLGVYRNKAKIVPAKD